MNIDKTQIEELRRRAKDNKAKIAEYYLNLSFDSIKDLRTILFALPAVSFGYAQISEEKISNISNFKTFLILSIIAGLFSYSLSFLAYLRNSEHYSKREEILSAAFPDMQQYQDMIKKETELAKTFQNPLIIIGFVFIILQAIFTIVALAFL